MSGGWRRAGGDISFEDIPRLTDAQLARMVRLRDVRRKVAVSVRLDPRVLEWLKSKGEGHLTRISDILTNLMEADVVRQPLAEALCGAFRRRLKAGCSLKSCPTRQHCRNQEAGRLTIGRSLTSCPTSNRHKAA